MRSAVTTRAAVLALLCAALLVAAYSNSFRNPFQFDDSHVVVNNVYIRSLQNIPHFFTDARTFSAQPRNASYRPIVSVSLALDYWLAGGTSPPVFHAAQLVELLLFAAVLACFYWWVMERCRPDPANVYLALFAATLFAVHTANTETMNLMHARSEIESAGGLLLGFLVYWSSPRLRRFHLYLLPVAVGALAKVPALIFAPLLFVWVFLDGQFRRERPVNPRRAAREAALAAAPALVASVLVYWFIERAMKAPTMTYAGGDRYQYALTQAWVWVQYLRLFFLPVGLTADSDLTLFTQWSDPRVLVGVAIIALLAAIAWRSARSPRAWPIAFGLAWFALGLLPTSSILPLAEPMNEHRIFLPYIGLVLAAVWAARLGFARLTARATVPTAAAIALCALVLLGHALGTHARNRVWSSGERLWGDVTQKSPGNGRAWMNYGLALMERGAYPEAKVAYERARELTPRYAFVEVNMGILSAAMGDHGAAEDHFRRARTLDPVEPSVHSFYGRWLISQDRGPEAVAELEETVRLSQADDASRRTLMDLRAAQGDDAGARRVAAEYLAILPANERAQAYLSGVTPIALTPGGYDAYFQKGLELGNQRSYVESALAYREAVRLKPESADALNNLGWTLGKLGFYPEAKPYLEQAVQLKPDFQLARNNLAWVTGKLP